MSDTTLNFIKNPSDYCNWVITPTSMKNSKKRGGLIAGGYPFSSLKYRKNHLDKLIDVGVSVFVNLTENTEIEKYGDYTNYVKKKISNPLFIRIPIPDRDISSDVNLFSQLSHVQSLMNKNKIVYVHCFGGHGRTGIFVSCFLMLYFGYSAKKALDRNRLLHLTRKYKPHMSTPQGSRQYAQVKRYKPPLTVIVTGDRDSSLSFRPIIRRALKDLPLGSTVVHGGCRGIDITAGEIALELNLKIKEYCITPEMWRRQGRAAGPIRNRKMLETKPDFVFAFHPDIQFSKGTKDMINAAYQKNIPVFVYDLKNKRKYEGVIDKM